MSDITPMPTNASNYYRKAMNALQNNDYKKGIHYLEKSYEIDPISYVFTELVNLYLSFQMTQKLSDIWKKLDYSIQDIAQSIPNTRLYAKSIPIINPTSEGLNELYQLKDLIQDSKTKQQINESIVSLQEILTTCKEIDQLNNSESINHFINKYSQSNQLNLLSKLKILYKNNLDKSEKLFLAILSRKDIFNFIKNDVLHFLITQDYKASLSYSWFQEDTTLDTQVLKPYSSSDFYIKGKELITDYFSNQDPHIESQVIELFNLHSMVLYPYYERAISDPKAWLDQTLMVYGLDADIDKNSSILTESELSYYQLAQEEIVTLLT